MSLTTMCQKEFDLWWENNCDDEWFRVVPCDAAYHVWCEGWYQVSGDSSPTFKASMKYNPMLFNNYWHATRNLARNRYFRREAAQSVFNAARHAAMATATAFLIENEEPKREPMTRFDKIVLGALVIGRAFGMGIVLYYTFNIIRSLL